MVKKILKKMMPFEEIMFEKKMFEDWNQVYEREWRSGIVFRDMYLLLLVF